ncbi:MAG: hypothetical protein PHX85_02275 [Methanobacteriaceae archaeon]|nr:hypothetical protein [Methanobacteriaceae archaeon]
MGLQRAGQLIDDFVLEQNLSVVFQDKIKEIEKQQENKETMSKFSSIRASLDKMKAIVNK